MNNIYFISGIGTDVGKTIVSAILTESLEADYWKPIQAGFTDGTDAESIRSLLTNTTSVVHTELYLLKTPASPHIAAKLDGVSIDLGRIKLKANEIANQCYPRKLIIEGAGGLMVPLSKDTFVFDLIKSLNAKVILVSRNYLGSINHSLLTAAVCKEKGLYVAGWIFNDDYMNYESEIVEWSGYPSLGSIKAIHIIDKEEVKLQADKLRETLIGHLKPIS